MLPLTVSEAEWHSLQLPTAMSDSQSIHTSLLEVMIFSKNAWVFIRDLTDRTLEIIFDASWASMNVGSKRTFGWKNSRHAPWWRFYLHCGIEVTGIPGIICSVCHHILQHRSEYGISSMGKHLLAKAHIPMLNELTESEVFELTCTAVEEKTLAILKRQGSRGITIVRLQKKIIFDNLVVSILTSLTDTTFKTGSKGLPNRRISPRYLESLPHGRISFSSHSLERDPKHRATTVI